MSNEHGPVKCAACGFLAVIRISPRELAEAEAEYRSRGHIADNNGRLVYEEFPVCFVRAARLKSEWVATRQAGQEPTGILKSERDCSAFIPWQQGFSPKEHVEMQLLEQQRTWQATRENDQRNWQKQESADNKKWRAFELFVMAVLVAGATIIAQLASAFIERGSWFADPKPPPVVTPEPTH